MCRFMVDATNIVARVTIKGDSNLGILENGYIMGAPITVPEGNVKYITLYNGNPHGGPISF